MSILSSAWVTEEGIERKSSWTLLWSPQEDGTIERIDFLKYKDVSDFIYLTYEVVLTLEGSEESFKREKESDSNGESDKYPGLLQGVGFDYFDEQLREAVITPDENPYIVSYNNFRKQNSPAARYARTEKGKLARKKWRQSPAAIQKSQERRAETKERNSRFKAIEKWLNANPGKDFGDVPIEIRSS